MKGSNTPSVQGSDTPSVKGSATPTGTGSCLVHTHHLKPTRYVDWGLTLGDTA